MKEGGALAIMTSYNRLNGSWLTEQEAMLYELRRQGYNALVVYGATEAVGVVKDEASLARVCLVILNLNEFLYVD